MLRAGKVRPSTNENTTTVPGPQTTSGRSSNSREIPSKSIPKLARFPLRIREKATVPLRRLTCISNKSRDLYSVASPLIIIPGYTQQLTLLYLAESIEHNAQVSFHVATSYVRYGNVFVLVVRPMYMTSAPNPLAK